MYPQTHFITGLFISLILVDLNIINFYSAFILAFLTFIVDIDHYIYYIIKTKHFNPKKLLYDIKFNRKFIKRTWFHFEKGTLLILLIAIIFLKINPQISLIIVVAYFLHIFLDIYSFNILELTELEKTKSYKITPHEILIEKFE